MPVDPLDADPNEEMFVGLAAPARRALIAAGYRRIEHFTKLTEDALLRLHGMGPNALAQIRRTLKAKGKALAARPRRSMKSPKPTGRIGMSYVDGFVMVVPRKNLAAYKKMAQKGGKVWMKHGALQYMECMGDDIEIKGIPLTFSKLQKTKRNEVSFFSFIVFKSRAHRDAVNKKVMADPEMHKGPKKMPFDFKRMAYGGFKAVVEH